MSSDVARPSVLIVDEIAENTVVVRDIIRATYPVRVVKTGDRALQLANLPQPPVLILLGTLITGLDSFETCRRLKLESATRSIPVIFLRKKPDSVEEVTSFSLGAADYINTSIDPAVLMARIRAHLTVKAATDFLLDENRILENQVAKRTQEALHDALTKLPNRRLLLERLQIAQAISKRKNQYGALMLLNLDKFRALNETLGRDVGDLILVEIANRLAACTRDVDALARLGSDEFVVVLEMLSHRIQEAAAQAEVIAEKIRYALEQPYVIRNHLHNVSSSIGVVLFKGGLPTIDELLEEANAAMHQAKRTGRNRVRFYDDELQEDLQRRMSLEEELRLALEKGQFRVLFQIQVDNMLKPLGAEGLLRWAHPQRGLLSPQNFLSPLEETGLITAIDYWVLKTVCTQLAAWQDDPLTQHLTLAVNISAKQFRQETFVEQVERVLAKTGANPAHLKLELTESTVRENVDVAILKMQDLKKLGVSLSMDDFGMGYSSLRYLKRLSLDQIKIDRSFVCGIENDADDAAIVRAIIAMGDALGLHVIAEGVETQEQWGFLTQSGCDIFQGYLFGLPCSAAEFHTLLKQQYHRTD